DDDHAAILVVNRLPSSRQIDDAEPARAEPDIGVEIDAVVVRSTVADARQHAVKYFGADRLAGAVRIHAANSTHESVLSLALFLRWNLCIPGRLGLLTRESRPLPLVCVGDGPMVDRHGLTGDDGWCAFRIELALSIPSHL